ncbi:hypothetical protein HY990_07195 [Candidatus Micrarchaeota archaeon]|nr:hypothetical protein [Candidatus Micrarchaeota archaeon]
MKFTLFEKEFELELIHFGIVILSVVIVAVITQFVFGAITNGIYNLQVVNPTLDFYTTLYLWRIVLELIRALDKVIVGGFAILIMKWLTKDPQKEAANVSLAFALTTSAAAVVLALIELTGDYYTPIFSNPSYFLTLIAGNLVSGFLVYGWVKILTEDNRRKTFEALILGIIAGTATGLLIETYTYIPFELGVWMQTLFSINELTRAAILLIDQIGFAIPIIYLGKKGKIDPWMIGFVLIWIIDNSYSLLGVNYANLIAGILMIAIIAIAINLKKEDQPKSPSL